MIYKKLASTMPKFIESSVVSLAMNLLCRLSKIEVDQRMIDT
jgi:hypothetical protein